MITQQLVDFIKGELQKGLSKEVISKELLSNGWQVQDIEAGFSSAALTPLDFSELSNGTGHVVASLDNVDTKPSSGILLKILIPIIILGLVAGGYYLYITKFQSQVVTVTTPPEIPNVEIPATTPEISPQAPVVEPVVTPTPEPPVNFTVTEANSSYDNNNPTAVSCDTSAGMSGSICKSLLVAWYRYETNRLAVKNQNIDSLVTFVGFNSNTTAFEDLTLYSMIYYIKYGTNINILSNDTFPLSIPSTITEFPSLTVPRNNSPLSSANLKEINDLKAFNSNLTAFPKELSTYSNKEEIVKDLEVKYKDKGANSITYSLRFNKNGDPVADVNGPDSKGNCYRAEYNLITKTGDLSLYGPCAVN